MTRQFSALEVGFGGDKGFNLPNVHSQVIHHLREIYHTIKLDSLDNNTLAEAAKNPYMGAICINGMEKNIFEVVNLGSKIRDEGYRNLILISRHGNDWENYIITAAIDSKVSPPIEMDYTWIYDPTTIHPGTEFNEKSAKSTMTIARLVDYIVKNRHHKWEEDFQKSLRSE